MSKNNNPKTQVEKFLLCFFGEEDECIYHTEFPRFLVKITQNPIMPFVMVDEIDNILEHYNGDREKCTALMKELCSFWSKYNNPPGEMPKQYFADYPLLKIKHPELQDKFVYCEYGNISTYTYHTQKPRFLAKIVERQLPPFEIVDDIDNMLTYYQGDKSQRNALIDAAYLWWKTLA